MHQPVGCTWLTRLNEAHSFPPWYAPVFGALEKERDVALDVGVAQDAVDARSLLRTLVQHGADQRHQLRRVLTRHLRHLQQRTVQEGAPVARFSKSVWSFSDVPQSPHR